MASLAAGVLHTAPAAAQDEATYRVQFQGNWTTASTPGGVVGGAHFTTLIGAVHGSGVTFWQSGGTASPGVEAVAELGAISTFRSEVQASAHTRSVIQRGVSGGGTGSATFTITATRTHPLVTLLSMIGPSPDWFVGVSGVSLLDSSDEWRDKYVVDLFPYDAGTENGTEFTLSNTATNPQGVITSIAGTGKFSNVRMARLTFTDQTPDPEPEASFASSSSRAGEGLGTRNVVVGFSPAPTSNITLNYTVGGTATEGSDYGISGSGSLPVSSGATTATIAVAITDDNAEESSETVVLRLTNGTGYTVGSPNRHTLTITDNDGEEPPPGIPSVSLEVSPNPVSEGRSVTVTAWLSEALSSSVTIPLTLTPGTAETDDFGLLGSITIDGGHIRGSGAIATARDADDDDETFAVGLGRLPDGLAAGDPSSVTVIIADADAGDRGATPPNRPPAVTLSCAPCSVMPGGEVSLTATATDADNDPLTYSWSAGQGSFAGAAGEAAARWTAPEDTGPVTIRVEVSDGEGGRVAAAIAVDVVLVPPEEAAFKIPNQGVAAFDTGGKAESLRAGYARIRADGGSSTPSGIAVFQFRDGEGVLITEAGVPASGLVRRGRFFAEVHGPVDTAVAFANPHSTPADIEFHLTDTNGNRAAEGTFTLDAHQHVATFLSAAPFDVERVEGAFTFSASAPLAVIAVRGLTNQAGEWLMTTLPVGPILPPPSPFTGTSIAPVSFPHFADGLGWTTQVILVNPTDEPIAGTVEFLDPDAAPAVLTLTDGRMGAKFDYAIPADGARRFTTSNAAGPLSSGWVRATPSRGASPSGLLVYSYIADGKTVSEAGVPVLGTSTAFRAPITAVGEPNRPGSIRTALAIANTVDTQSTIALEITRPDGSLVRPMAILTLPPLGQAARLLDEIVELPDDFTSGLLRVRATGEVAVIALRIRINARGELKATTTLPSNEIARATSEDRFFAHLADSEGWTTELILFSGTVGEASSGTLGEYWFPVP